jgi:transposase
MAAPGRKLLSDNQIKEFRRIATRYNKTDTSFQAAIHLVATVLTSK